MKKLKEPEEPLTRFINIARKLFAKTGPVLFQLPPRWKSNPKRFEAFAQVLKKRKGYQFVFEFRDNSWFTKEIKEILKKYKLGFCVYRMPEFTSPIWKTS